MNKNNFKLFFNLAKAQSKDGKRMITGVASGTLEDQDGQRLNKNLILKFIDKINTQGLPLTDAHADDGVLKDLGDINSATGETKFDDRGREYYEMTIEAVLDDDNVATQTLWNKLQKGKQYGLSIEGNNPQCITVFSESLNQYITEFVDADPVAVSVTVKPSYAPTFIEALKKSVQKIKDEGLDKNNLINDTDTMKKDPKDKKELDNSQETTSEVEVNETETVVADKTVDNAQAENAESSETNAETENTETTEASTETNEAVVESDDKLKKSTDEKETLIKSIVESLDKLGYKVEPKEEAKSVEEKSVKVKKSKTGSSDKLMKSHIDNAVSEIKNSFVAALTEIKGIQKSLHDDVEVIKGLPLGKKSKVQTLAKSFDERVFPETKESNADVIKDLLDPKV